MALINFDATQVPPDERLEPIPAGIYNVQIVDSEMKPTGGGAGQMLVLQLAVLDGPHAGRRIFDNLNLENANPTTVEISYKRLSSYSHATNVLKVSDSQQLHGIPFSARIGVKVDKTGTYDPQNDVKRVGKLGDLQVTPGMQAPQPAFGAQPPAGFGRPAPTAQPVAPAQPTAMAPPVSQAPQAVPAASVPQAPSAGAAPAGTRPPWAKRG